MRRIRPLLSMCLAGVCLTPALPAPACAGPAEGMAVQRLLAGAPDRGVATTAAATGAIVALRGAAIALPGGASEPAAAACAWVLEHAGAFGLRAGADQVQVEMDEPLPGGSHRVLLRQSRNGVPVESGDARVVVDASGRLRFVASGFLAGIDAPAAPRVAREEAIAIAAGSAGAALARTPAAAGLWIRRRAGVDRLAWRVGLSLANGLEPAVWVDAVSGEVLATETGCANAVGLVYPTDPRGPLEERPLDGLLPGVGLVSHLLGLEDESNPPVTPIGPDGDYRYPPTDPSFDQVNVYWHVNRYLREFMAGLGYPGPPDSLVVRINVATEPFVALTNGRFVYLGRPIAGFVQDVSRCQDVIYHELTHTVIYGYGITPTGPNAEAAAFHEGVADYFAAALTNDPVIGEWLYLTFPNGCTRLDQPADKWNYLNYDKVGFAGGDVGSPWGNGMILSSGLWDLRRDLGASADSLVLESLVYLPSAPIWAQFANALLEADEVHHGGRLAPAIVYELLRRDIRGAAVAAISGPTTLGPGVEGEFDAQPCCNGVVGRDHWRERSWCRGGPCGDWRDVGDGPTLRLTLDDDSEIQLSVETPWGDTLTTSQFVGVRPPQLAVEGPQRVSQHARATWKARFAAMGPAHVTWMRQWRRPGAPIEQLGEDAEQTFAADTSLDLTATLVDGLGRVTAQRIGVDTFVDQPPPEGAPTTALRQLLDAGARNAQTTLELARASSVQLCVFDVRGRLRVTLWDGPAERGTHVVRWNAGGLEPGIYFLRLRAEPAGLLQRFLVLR